MNSRFLRLRHKALILRDVGGYAIANGECNPVIFESFFEKMIDEELPMVIWEPFAGHNGFRGTLNFLYSQNIPNLCMMAQDIAPSDPRVTQGDSTVKGPPSRPFGLFFHPSYYGYSFSDTDGEVGRFSDFASYMDALTETVKLARQQEGALACVVCRVYRYKGEQINLPEAFLAMFEKLEYSLIEVWSSEPDMVLIMRKL